jgi:nitrite reductase/ring-hydroxylating ferredoxin subunit
VASVSKIRFFSIVLTLAIVIGSCSKKNDVIPDVYVDFTLDLFDPEFVSLNAIGSDTVNAQTNNWGRSAAGFDNNGIIVYNGGDGQFYAYDRTCPHDYEVNSLSIKVKIDFTIAFCPKCGTTYALSASGTPASGIGRYPLKNYRTSFDGRYVRVYN